MQDSPDNTNTLALWMDARFHRVGHGRDQPETSQSPARVKRESIRCCVLTVLQIHEFAIWAVWVGHQRIVATRIRDPAFFEEDDAVGGSYR